jgi:hypothetical protein
MNKREYLISVGLAKPGRGRFSAEAEAAWASLDHDWAETIPSEPVNPDSGYEDVELPFEEVPAGDMGTSEPEVEYAPELPRTPLRKETLAYTIDDGVMIAHLNCGSCNNLIAYCACADGPGKVRWVKEEQKPYLVEV